jgi:ATP-dependent protease ClpP protease subunit
MQHFDEDEMDELDRFRGNLENEIIRAGLKRRTLYIYKSIDREMEMYIVRFIEKFSNPKEYKKEPIHIKISSEGGEVFSSLAIISAIEKAKDLGYKVIGYTHGKCMSAAVNIFISCTERVSSRHCRYLIHDLGSWQMGFQSREDIKDSYEEHKELWERMRMLIIKDTKIEPSFLDELVSRKKEYSFWPNEALELGFCDIIE